MGKTYKDSPQKWQKKNGQKPKKHGGHKHGGKSGHESDKGYRDDQFNAE